jgi:TetR/AcrR family transcriptional repressor of mexAB-oprM operon
MGEASSTLPGWLRDPTPCDPLSDTAPMLDACFRGLVRDWQ